MGGHNGIYGHAYESTEVGRYGTATGAVTSDGNGELTIPVNGVAFLTFVTRGETASRAVRWVPYKSFRIGAIGAGAEEIIVSIRLSDGTQLIITVLDTGSNTAFNLKVYTNATATLVGATARFTGPTAFSYSTDYTMMPYRDGVNIALDANGIFQGSFASALDFAVGGTWQLGSAGLNVAGVNLVFGIWMFEETDNLRDKPNPASLTAVVKYPDPAAGGTPVKDQFNNIGGTNKADSTDDDPHNSDTDYIADPGTASSTFDQSLFTTAATMAAPEVVVVSRVLRTTDDQKSLHCWVGIADTGTAVWRVADDFVPAAAYTIRSGYGFKDDANGTAWATQTQLNNLEIGVRSVIGAQAVNQRCTAIMAEAIHIDLTGPSDVVELNQAVKRSNEW